MKQFRQTLAVVDDSFLYTCGHKYAHGGFDDIADLVLLAERHGITHVWAVTGTDVSRLAQGPFVDTPDKVGVWNVSGIGGDNFSYLSVRRTEKTHEDHIEIGFPEWSRWPWKKSSNSAAGLLQTLIFLEEILGFPVAYTPAWCSVELFKRLNAGRWDWLEPVTLDLEEKGFSYADDIARELHWPPKGREPVIPACATHLIRVDGNSKYNAAETGLRVGQGNPTWVTSGALYDGKKPGIWQVRIKRKPNRLYAWNGQALPDLTTRKWMTTDMIEQVIRCDFYVEIECGWTWTKYHQTLRSFAETLWPERLKWRPLAARGGAYESVYDSVCIMLKALHGKLARPDNAPRFRRRDIWAMVVARAVAMSVYQIEHIHRVYGLWPVRIKADEFTYAVQDVHIFDNLVSRDKLGGLKLVEVKEIERNAEA